MSKITRADYMAGRCTFREFYAAVLQTAGIKWRDGNITLEECRKAYANGDELLNTIELARWDAWALRYEAALSRALKEHGDFYSLAGGVAALKVAAWIELEKAA